jgi:hypothetical protein
MIERGWPITALLVDDTVFLERGEHFVGVARQYRGQLGDADNQVVEAYPVQPTAPRQYSVSDSCGIADAAEVPQAACCVSKVCHSWGFPDGRHRHILESRMSDRR